MFFRQVRTKPEGMLESNGVTPRVAWNLLRHEEVIDRRDHDASTRLDQVPVSIPNVQYTDMSHRRHLVLRSRSVLGDFPFPPSEEEAARTYRVTVSRSNESSPLFVEDFLDSVQVRPDDEECRVGAQV